jgi:hypothetical protein
MVDHSPPVPRLTPAPAGPPDSRPDVREKAGILGNLVSDFDFSQAPRSSFILPQHPVAPVPGKRGGAPIVGVITQHRSTFVRVQVTATVASLGSLLGHVIRLSLPARLPVYWKGRYATHAVLHVGDAVLAILVHSKSGRLRATQLDDLGR